MNEFNFINQNLVYLYCSGVRQETERKIIGKDINDLILNCLQLTRIEPNYEFSANCFICWLYNKKTINSLYGIDPSIYEFQIKCYDSENHLILC